jgi:hypothetical protein
MSKFTEADRCKLDSIEHNATCNETNDTRGTAWIILAIGISIALIILALSNDRVWFAG